MTRARPGFPRSSEATTCQGWAVRQHRAKAGADRPVDLVFVHGMSAGGWIWPQAWLDRFTTRGYDCWSLTLPGRETGGAARDLAGAGLRLGEALQSGDAHAALALLSTAAPGASFPDGPSLEDFTDALEAALAQIARPCVVVGHSLGGAVAQCLLKRGRGPAGTVLLASVPPYGTWRASAEMAMLQPELWCNLALFSLWGLNAVDLNVLRKGFFPGGIEDAVFEGLVQNLRDESLTATLQAAGLPPFAPLPGFRRDVLVLGGARDRMVPTLDTVMTAAYYGSMARIIPGAGHMMMLEPEAAEAASARILEWLQERDAT